MRVQRSWAVRLASIAAAMLFPAAFFSCREQQDEPLPPELKVQSESIALTRLNALNLIKFRSDRTWYAESWDEWITVTPASGEAGEELTIKVTAPDYYERFAREGEIEIISGSLTATVKVRQSGANDKTISDFHRRIAGENHAHQYICAHRANTYEGTYKTKDCPENTVAAVNKAIEKGLDMVEIDVRKTKDGVLVCCHDDVISNVTTGSGNIVDMTYGEICAYDMIIRASGRTVQGMKMSTLTQVLKAAKGKIWVTLDLVKDKTDAFVKVAVDTIKAAGMEDQVSIYVGSSQALATSYYNYSGSKLAMNFWVSNDSGIAKISNFVTTPVFQYTGDGWGTSTENAGAVAVRQAGYAGFSNHLNYDSKLLQGDVTALNNMIEAKVDIIQTDFGDHAKMQETLKGLNLR